MSAPVFLVDPAVLAAVDTGDLVVLDGPEGRHAVTVRRLAAGEPLVLADGEGTSVAGEVVEVVGRDLLQVRVVTRTELPAASPRVVVAQALPKGERSDLAVELLTEVGVDVVVPWAAARAVVQWRGEKAVRGADKWRTTAREAAKQSRRTRVPHVTPLASIDDVVALVAAAELALVLHESATEVLAASVGVGLTGDVVVVVGPEGGLAPEELAAFAAAGARVVAAGPTVMRTSTAGAVAAALVLASSGRWST